MEDQPRSPSGHDKLVAAVGLRQVGAAVQIRETVHLGTQVHYGTIYGNTQGK